MYKNKVNKFVSLLLAVLMLLTVIPLSVFAAPASDIPADMLDNVYLDALAYTGYDVQAQKDNGTIYKVFGTRLANNYPSILSGIGYDSSYRLTGTETTSAGKPDIAKFKSYGLCCASYVSYVYFNYLPNVAGIDTSKLTRPSSLQTAASWSDAAAKWVANGQAKKVSFTQNSDGTGFKTSEEIPIGSLIVFKPTDGGRINHVALYAGEYDGSHFITHVGNSHGPEFSTIENAMKSTTPELVYQVFVPNIFEVFGSIKIYKKDTNGKNLSGAEFSATAKSDGKVYKIGPTDSTGYAFFDELPYDTYTVKETKFPEHYHSYGQTEWTVTINSSNNGIVVINAVNEINAGKAKIVKTSEDGVVANIPFRIQGNGVDQTVKTKNDGTIDVELAPGTYTVTELSADRYVPQESQKVTVVTDQTATVTFNNKLKRGSLTVTKTAEDGLVEGVTLHLYGTSDSGLKVDEYRTVGADGKANFNDVLIGSNYILEEVGVSDRYVIPDSQTVNIEWNKVTNKSIDNVLKKWNLTVTKSDSETGTAQGDASLAGAVYGIYQGDELIDTYTTDTSGSFTTKDYVCGDDWSLREITPSEGYLLDETVYHIGAEAKNYTVEYNSLSLGVTEQIAKGKIALIKHIDDGSTQIETPEEGAEFEVFLKSAGSYVNADESVRDLLVCDAYGFDETKDLPYGLYTVKQTKGWEGRELLPAFDVFVNEDGKTYRFLINNANFESYIKIVKTDAETGKTIPYAGAGFQIYDPDGNLITMSFTYPTPTTIDTFYTNENGVLITPEQLPYGCGFALVEVQAPYGYVLNSKPIYFDVTAENAKEENGVTVIEVVRANMPQKGKITVAKTGEVFS